MFVRVCASVFGFFVVCVCVSVCLRPCVCAGVRVSLYGFLRVCVCPCVRECVYVFACM